MNSTLGTRNHLEQLDEDQDEIVQEQPTQQTVHTGYPFMPLYSHYSLGQRLKSTLPFSKLFFPSSASSHIQDTLIKSITSNKHTENHSSSSNNSKTMSYTIKHDKEQCMFLIKLDSKGRTAALCYLPTRVKCVIEVYHTEIPMRYRHQGIGDKLVKQCLDWAKESGTLVIPTCHFVQRHLEYVGHHKYDSIIVKTEQEASTFPLDIQSINCSNKQE